MLAVGIEKKPCTYCKQEFYPSRYRPDQRVCSSTDCQRRRRTDYHRQKLATDPVYQEQGRDSQKKWREKNPGYMKRYRAKHRIGCHRDVERSRSLNLLNRLADSVKNNSLKITPDSSYKNDGCLREGTGRETDSSQDSEMRRLSSRDPRCQTSGGNGRDRTKINPIIAKQTERSPPSRIRPLCPPSTNSTPPRTDEAKLVSTIKDIAPPTMSRDAEEG